MLRVAGLVLLAACSDMTAAPRDDWYEWRLIVPDGAAQDTLNFTWPNDRVPVRFWALDTLNLPARVDAAIDAWQKQFLYAEFRGERVSDPDDADVVIVGGPPGSIPAFRSTASECNGATDVEIDQTSRLLTLPMIVYIDTPFEEDAPGVDSCLSLTTAHEIGHALGIFQHSDDPSDLMFFNPTFAGPSDRDRTTAQRAYHTPSTVTISRE